MTIELSILELAPPKLQFGGASAHSDPKIGLALPKSHNAWAWPAYPLEPVACGEERYADITFRIGLIARLSGRPVELV